MSRALSVWFLVPLLLACESEEPAPPAEEPSAEEPEQNTVQALRERVQPVFGELPEAMPREGEKLTKAKIDLGRMLYYDTRLSLDQDLSCNSCHGLDTYGVDNEPTSPGHKGQRGERNSPTVYHAAGHLAQFWDGRAADVEEQAKGPVLNPVEMAMPDEKTVVARLQAEPAYAAAFTAAFPEAEAAINYDNMASAIGAFERKLVTPAPFDAWLAGEDDALSETQLEGLQLFMDTGCTTCHSGALLGGNMYQKLGLVEPYETEDLGRGALTGKEADNYFFKVPSLRNVEKTAPYFHDGSIEQLEQAVNLMAKHQLGKSLSKEEIGAITSFLESLTGELPEEYIKRPVLPGEADSTGKGAKAGKAGKRP